MTSLSQFLNAAGGKPVLGHQEVATVTSGTWTTPVKGRYLVTGIGGGGAGTSNAGGVGSAGGAGGLAQSEVDLEAGVVLTLTVGAGGIGQTGAYGTGTDGGTTTITCPSFTTLTAYGGKGGTSNYNTALADGGTASGGNIMNITGGKGGRGGGAVGVYGIGYSGNILSNAGAGVGGPPATSITASPYLFSYPGTSMFSGDEIYNNRLCLEQYVNPLYVYGGGIINSFRNGRFLSPTGGFVLGIDNTQKTQSGPGTGGGGSIYTYSSGFSYAGLFAGGARTSSSYLEGADLARGGAFGGGGGAGYGGFSGNGGVGGVVIEYIPVP